VHTSSQEAILIASSVLYVVACFYVAYVVIKTFRSGRFTHQMHIAWPIGALFISNCSR
jgi:hypothetical protein